MMMNVMRLVSVARNLHGCRAVQMDWWMPAASLLHWRASCWCLPVTLVKQTVMECQQFLVDSAHLLEPVLVLCLFPIHGGHIFSHPCRWERDFLHQSLTAGHPAIRRHFSLNSLSIAISTHRD